MTLTIFWGIVWVIVAVIGGDFGPELTKSGNSFNSGNGDNYANIENIVQAYEGCRACA